MLNSVQLGPLSNAASATSPGLGAPAQSGVKGADFGAMLSDLASQSVAAIKQGETTAIAGMQGKASVQQVVMDVMAAEQALNTGIAVRDKVVSAYLELTRMQI